MFSQALTEITSLLEKAKTNGLVQKYALIGGFAVSAWGVPRATNDLDFALAVGSADPGDLATLLKAEFHPGDLNDPLRGVFRCSLKIEDYTIPVQLILLPAVWEHLVFQKVVSLAVFGCTVPVVNWQSLVLLKLYAGGPQDLLDARQILAVRQPNRNELQEVTQLAEQVNLLADFQALAIRLPD